MNYIYDIALNFQDEYYDFYQWDKKDKIINVRKTNVIKLKDEDYIAFKYNKIKVDKNFLELIDGSSLYFKEAFHLEYLTLVTNGKETMGVLFDKEGNLLKRSGLVFDEADEAIDFCTSLKYTQVEYLINEKGNNNAFKLRKETEKKGSIKTFIEKENNIDVLKYLYFDYFEKENENIEIMKIDLLNIINNKWNDKLNKLYKSVQLIKSGSKKKV